MAVSSGASDWIHLEALNRYPNLKVCFSESGIGWIPYLLERAEFTNVDAPIDDTCGCAVCAVHSRGYLRHLFQVGEPSASRLVSLHNLAWTIALMGQARSAILTGTFGAFRKQVLDVWA